MTALLMELNEYRWAVNTWIVTLDNATKEEMNRIFQLMKDRCVYLTLGLRDVTLGGKIIPLGHSVLDGYFHLNEEHTFEEMRLLLGDGFCIEPVDEATDEDLAAQIWDHAYKVVRHGNRMGDRITDSSSGMASPVSHS